MICINLWVIIYFQIEIQASVLFLVQWLLLSLPVSVSSVAAYSCNNIKLILFLPFILCIQLHLQSFLWALFFLHHCNNFFYKSLDTSFIPPGYRCFQNCNLKIILEFLLVFQWCFFVVLGFFAVFYFCNLVCYIKGQLNNLKSWYCVIMRCQNIECIH